MRNPDGGIIGTVPVGADGSFTIALAPPRLNGETLSATQSDAAGNVSPPTFDAALDTTAPAAPTAAIGVDGATVTGVGEAGATVTVTGPGGAPLGYSVLTAPDFPIDRQPGDVELRRIYTLSLTRGTGLGAALMAQAIADARSRGATRMLLGVFARNHRACDFYERQGFVLAGERQFKVGATWHDDRVYSRLL